MKKILLALLASALFASAAELRTIKDMDGAEVKIPAKVERIAALWHSNNQILLALGGADKIVATTDNISKNAWFLKIYPRLAQIPVLLKNNDVNLEELMSRNPDVVIISTALAGENLAKQGFTVLKASFSDYEQMRRSIRMCGDMLGGDAPQRAKDLIANLDKNIALVSGRTANLSPDKRPRVLHIVGGSDLLKIDGKGTLIDSWIELAGGTNAITATKGPMKTITAEEIIASNPQIIIVGGDQNEDAVEKIKSSPVYSGTDAVKNGRVYGNPRGVFNWDRYGADTVLQILWAAKTIQPELFADIDIKAETKAFYKKFMNYELSDAEFGYILKGLNPEGK